MSAAHNLPATSPAGEPSRVTTPTIQIIDEEGRGVMEDFDDGASESNEVAIEKTSAGVQSILYERALHNKDNDRFWPELILNEILTEIVIADLLCIDDVLANKIATHHRKVLAILILHEREEEIQLFIDENVRDEDLPLSWDSSQQTRPCFSKWRKFELDSFRNTQYEMIPLFLDFEGDGTTVRQINLEPKFVLPFLTEESSGAGGYSEVNKVVIDARSHGFDRALKSVGRAGDRHRIFC